MDLVLDYTKSFPPTIPTVLVHKILNMRPRHPVAELVAAETLELMIQELTNFYIDGGGHVWDPYTGFHLDVSVNQMLDSCMFPLHRRWLKGGRQAAGRRALAKPADPIESSLRAGSAHPGGRVAEPAPRGMQEGLCDQERAGWGTRALQSEHIKPEVLG